MTDKSPSKAEILEFLLRIENRLSELLAEQHAVLTEITLAKNRLRDLAESLAMGESEDAV